MKWEQKLDNNDKGYQELLQLYEDLETTPKRQPIQISALILVYIKQFFNALKTSHIVKNS